MKIILHVLVIMVLFACGSSKKNNSSSSQTLQGFFKIIQVKANSNIHSKVHIHFDKNQQKISGNAGCNQFFGSFTQKDRNLSLSQLAVTKMLCFDENINKTEAEILQLLEQIATYEFKEEQLHLLDNKGTLLFVATPLDEIKSKELSNSEFKVTYSISTMSGQEQVIMTDQKVTCKKGLQGETEVSHSILPHIAKQMKDKLSTLPYDKIETLKSPTNARHLDGAAYSIITIEYGGKTFKTKDFDHGNPPTELHGLVKLLLDNTPCL